MSLNPSTNTKDVSEKTYAELFKERGVRCCLINVVVVCVFFYVSGGSGPVWEYILFFLTSTLFDTISPKMLQKYLKKSSNTNK